MKNRQFKLFFALFLFSFSSIYSQYTKIINSNKPGFSQSPYSVGTGIYQFEGNIFFRNTDAKSTLSKPQSLGANLFFRTSFFLEKLELNSQVALQRDKILPNITESPYFSSGLSKFSVGLKYLLFQQKFTDKSREIRSWKKRFAFDAKRLIPSVAIYLGINTDFENNIKMNPKVGILLQNDLTNNFNLITNLYFNKIGSDFQEFSYIVTATKNFSDRWSAFVENQTVFKKYQNNTNIGVGLAYLYLKNLQINTSTRMLFEGKTRGFYIGMGVSYRIDKHKDSFVYLDNNGIPLKNKKRGFFSRIFKKRNNL